MLKEAYSVSQEKFSNTVASIHHHLFENAVHRGSEKARLSLLFLRSKFSRIAQFPPNGVGIFFHEYARAWFRFLISLEAQALFYLALIDHSKLSGLTSENEKIKDNLEKTFAKFVSV